MISSRTCAQIKWQCCNFWSDILTIALGTLYPVYLKCVRNLYQLIPATLLIPNAVIYAIHPNEAVLFQSDKSIRHHIFFHHRPRNLY